MGVSGAQRICTYETGACRPYERLVAEAAAISDFNFNRSWRHCSPNCSGGFEPLAGDFREVLGGVRRARIRGTVADRTAPQTAEHVAALIRTALEYIRPERLVVTTDWGFRREGLSRRIAYYKCVALVEGTNIVRRELGLPEAHIRADDPKLYFANVGEI